MKFITRHWYDVGAGLSICVLVYLFQAKDLANYDYVMWLSLVSLFWHQLEEYRVVGTFPGMVNGIMYNSDLPGRYPSAGFPFFSAFWVCWRLWKVVMRFILVFALSIAHL